MRCETLMTREVVAVGIRDPVAEAAKKMREFNVGFLPVCDDSQRVVGVVTDRDLVTRVLASDGDGQTPVQDAMTDVVTCNPHDDIRRAEALMQGNQINRVVVIDDEGKAAGIISFADVVRYEDETRAGRLASDIAEREVEVRS